MDIQKTGRDEQFIHWVRLLFKNAFVATNLHGTPSRNFKIERGIRKGCPPAPHNFFIVGEVLTDIINNAMTEGGVTCVNLSRRGGQHCIS